jgi:hypothetical protein
VRCAVFHCGVTCQTAGIARRRQLAAASQQQYFHAAGRCPVGGSLIVCNNSATSHGCNIGTRSQSASLSTNPAFSSLVGVANRLELL